MERGLLGVTIQEVTSGLAQALKLDRTNGVLVSDVAPNSPAQTAGIKGGDLIVKFNNQPVESPNQLKLRVAETTPGTTVPVEVDRGGEMKTFDVTIKELSGNSLARSTQSAPSGSAQNELLRGVAVTNLDAQTRTDLQVPDSVQGALVTDVNQNSPAYDAGLRSGDVITEINHHAIRNADEAVDLTQHPSKGEETLVKVWSHGGNRYLAVPTGQES